MAALPAGRYLSCAYRLREEAGGQTRAMLSRNRMFAELGGVRPDLLELGPRGELAALDASLREQGLLGPGVGLRNLYVHYREHGWGDEPGGAPLSDLSAHATAEDTTADGTPWRRTYRPPGAPRAVFDFLRPDGTPWLRMPGFSLSVRSTWPERLERVGPDGRVCGAFGSLGQWFRRWLRELAGAEERAFVFLDSRFLVPHLAPMRGRRFHLIYQMHNLHVEPPFEWDSPASRVYERVLGRIGGLDAFVTLTERQGDDIAQRRGRTTNLAVVPNPTEPPAPRAQERDPLRVSILARLAGQKRLDHAIAVWEQVTAAVPGARLDVYGEGPQRAQLEAQIDATGLRGAITLHGFRPAAADALWESSAFLLTSRYEGYPLSVLEALGRGCPVVAYDIKYGPREQIEDGVEGFLVADGDVAGAAARVVELLRSPELVARMSAAARQRAARSAPAAILPRWSEVVAGAIARKPTRVRLDAVTYEPRRRLLRRRGLDGVVRLAGRGDPALARVELAAVDGPRVTPVALDARRDGRAFRVRAEPPPGARLRLRVVWENAARDLWI